MRVLGLSTGRTQDSGMGALSPATTAAHDHMDYFAKVPANGQLWPAWISLRKSVYRNPSYLTVATLVAVDARSPCLRVVAHACARPDLENTHAYIYKCLENTHLYTNAYTYIYWWSVYIGSQLIGHANLYTRRSIRNISTS